MNFGYIKLYRELLYHTVFQNSKLYHFFSYCLLKASHKNRVAVIGFKDIELSKGQFVFGRLKASQELPLSVQEIRTCVNKLQKLGIITIKSTNKYSIITVVNWEAYQSTGQDDNQQDNQQTTSKQPANNQQITSKQPANNQQITTDKNVKNVEHVENDKNVKNGENVKPLSSGKKNDKPCLLSILKNKINESRLNGIENIIIDFFNYRQSMKPKDRYNTERGINGLFRNLNGCNQLGYNLAECLEIAMERGWKTPDPAYYDKIFRSNHNGFNNQAQQLPFNGQKLEPHVQALVDSGKISSSGGVLMQRGLNISKEMEGENG